MLSTRELINRIKALAEDTTHYDLLYEDCLGDLPTKDIIAILNTFKEKKNLIFLGLGFNALWLKLDELPQILASLQGMELTHLCLSNNYFCKESEVMIRRAPYGEPLQVIPLITGQKIAAGLSTLKHTKIKHLDLRANFSSKSEMSHALMGLIDTFVTHLDLAGNRLWGSDRALDFSSNKLQNDDPTRVFEALQGSSVQYINLTNNCIWKASEETLKKSFKAIPESVSSIGLSFAELKKMTIGQRRAIYERFPSIQNITILDKKEIGRTIFRKQQTKINARLFAQAKRTAELDETCLLGLLPLEVMQHINNYAAEGSYPGIFFENFGPVTQDAVSSEASKEVSLSI